MHFAKISSAILALGIASVSATTCTKDIKITENNQVIDCDTVAAQITIDPKLAGDVVINGPKKIEGDLIVKGAKNLNSLSSQTIQSITGTFQLEGLESLANLDFSYLREIGTLTLIRTTLLTQLSFGTGAKLEIESIQITDTRIVDLSGLSVTTVKNFQINDNPKITIFQSSLVNVTGQLIIFENGKDMEIELPDLENCKEFQISNVKTFKAPALATVSASIKFDQNPELTSVTFPNLTTVGADVAFSNNKKLAEITMKKVEECQGFTIQNNSALEVIDGFPKLAKVAAINLRGDFEEVKLPALEDVAGTVTVTSTTDISEFCGFFDDLEKDDKIQGKMECTSNNKKANEGGDDGEATRTDSSDASSSSSASSDKDNAAGMATVNLAALGLAALFAFTQLL